ncbi:hypothetical protein K788_0006957 (plasmid) [Paraburkholderia caribensis MBA4]|uniref:Uncharacterized protein n=1 Tax=Paraburkholderia caribensis MBA4 TaxID=1323664 RepID=A0A0P0RPF9_9BURK|nr:hypothetical protein [Paraburkholderia caribensis]ALL70944.1 hypothetical protein K788_0006957 [Paraburkholderia caribensis MBA4]
MSDDASFGASLYRRHTTAALSAQTRDGARASFGEALYARHAQFSQQLLRRAGAREASGGAQRTFVVARRVAAATGDEDDAGASVVADAAGEHAALATSSMPEGRAVARHDARSAMGERAAMQHRAAAAVALSRRVQESRDEAVHVPRLAEVADTEASRDAGRPGGFDVSDAPEPRVAVRAPESMPSVGMALRSTRESHAIGRILPTPLAIALTPAARLGSPIALHAAHAFLMRAGVSEHAHIEASPHGPVLHDAVIARQTHGDPTTPYVTRIAEAPIMRRAATTVAHEVSIASLKPDPASDARLPASGAGSAWSSSDAAGKAPPFAAHPIAHAVQSASRSTDPAAVADVLARMPLVSRQLPSPTSAPASVNRAVGAPTTPAPTNLIVERAVSKMPGPQANAPSVHMSSAVAPAPERAAVVLRRGIAAATSLPGISNVSSAGSTSRPSNDAARVSRKVDASQSAVASSAAGESPAKGSASAAPLPRIPTASAARIATMPMPVVRATEHASRSEHPQGIDPAAVASIGMKETPLSHAIRRAVDTSREPHQAAAMHGTASPSSATRPFVDTVRAASRPLTHEMAHPGGAIERQPELPLARAMAIAALAAGGDTQAPFAHDAAPPASAIDRARQPLEHAATHATPPIPVDGASPREPAPANTVYRSPVTSAVVKPQPLVFRTAELPLRLARAPREPHALRSVGAPATAWTGRVIAPASQASEPMFVDRTAEQYGLVSPMTSGTPITRDPGAPPTASTPPPAVSPVGSTPAAATAGPNTAIDAGELAERAWQLMLDRLAIEQERRGNTSWA